MQQQLLKDALDALIFADEEMICVEPYEHSDSETVDAHYHLRETIEKIEQYLNGVSVEEATVELDHEAGC